MVAIWRTIWLGAFILVGPFIGMALSHDTAAAQDCDSTSSIIPADGSFSYSVTPICGGDQQFDIVTGGTGLVGGSGLIVTGGTATTTGVGSTAYTSPGNTAYVNGQPVQTPFTNISLYTPSQAAAARASGNPSATSNAYSQYGGFTPPGDTATRSHGSSVSLQGY